MSEYIATSFAGLTASGIDSNKLVGMHSLTLTAKLSATEFQTITGATKDFKLIVTDCVPTSLLT